MSFINLVERRHVATSYEKAPLNDKISLTSYTLMI